MKNPRSSFPVFYDKPRKFVPRFKRDVSQAYLYIVKTEKLSPITKDILKDIEYYLYYSYDFLDDMINRYKDKDGYETMWVEMKNRMFNLEKKYPSLPTFKKDYQFLLESSYEDARFGELDLHYRNIMQRSNGELVIIDPFWEGETPHQQHAKLVSREIGNFPDEPTTPMLKGGELPKKTKYTPKTSTDPDTFHSISYGDDFNVFEQTVDKKEYERRYEFIQNYIDGLRSEEHTSELQSH